MGSSYAIITAATYPLTIKKTLSVSVPLFFSSPEVFQQHDSLNILFPCRSRTIMKKLPEAFRKKRTGRLKPFRDNTETALCCRKSADLEPVAAMLPTWPASELHMTIPVHLDDGTACACTKQDTGYDTMTRANRDKGFNRCHPHENIDAIRTLAAWMRLESRWKPDNISTYLYIFD